MKAPTVVVKFLREIASKGGQQRTKNLSPERRREIARIASKARWGKKSSKNGL